MCVRGSGIVFDHLFPNRFDAGSARGFLEEFLGSGEGLPSRGQRRIGHNRFKVVEARDDGTPRRDRRFEDPGGAVDTSDGVDALVATDVAGADLLDVSSVADTLATADIADAAADAGAPLADALTADTLADIDWETIFSDCEKAIGS